MVPETLEVSEPEWTAWRPENFGPEYLGTESRVLVNPSSENLATEAQWSPQTNQGHPEQLHLEPVPGREYLAGCPCQARHLFIADGGK